MAFAPALTRSRRTVMAAAIVPFPRGFAFGHDGRFFLASGIDPNGVGDNAVVAFDPGERMGPVRLVSDPELSPLDLAIAPNGNIVVSSERPFGASDAGRLFARIRRRGRTSCASSRSGGLAGFAGGAGLRFEPDGHLYRVAQTRFGVRYQ